MADTRVGKLGGVVGIGGVGMTWGGGLHCKAVFCGRGYLVLFTGLRVVGRNGLALGRRWEYFALCMGRIGRIVLLGNLGAGILEVTGLFLDVVGFFFDDGLAC